LEWFVFIPYSEQLQLNTVGGDTTNLNGIEDAEINSNWDESIDSLDDMGLPDELLRGFYSHGFEKPSAIQQRAIGIQMEIVRFLNRLWKHIGRFVIK